MAKEDAFIGEVLESPGPLTFAVDAEGRMLWLQFLDGDYPFTVEGELERRGFRPRSNTGHCDLAGHELLEYCRGQRLAFTVPVRLMGTAWQQDVWRELLRIPFGQTRTYGQIAASLGRPGAARAMGRANATNPISLVVPCHRVLGATGKLTGFGGGLHIKERLLAHERRVLQERAG